MGLGFARALRKRACSCERTYAGDMLRQKKYHDTKVYWSSFETGDMVYVYFPVRKSGCSPKLTSFWRGPFEVQNKLSDVLYTVACGSRGKNTVIHCDRMRRCQPQILQGETEKDLVEKEEDQIVEEQSQDNVLVAEGPCALRTKNLPKWLQDYEVDYSA